uniref:Uncharacterized protein n=1 Tax=Methanococcus maripaludis (strain C6 / ATCC BAA-1332) TaxID=444158 RepID=A9A6U0_METM6
MEIPTLKSKFRENIFFSMILAFSFLGFVPYFGGVVTLYLIMAVILTAISFFYILAEYSYLMFCSNAGLIGSCYRITYIDGTSEEIFESSKFIDSLILNSRNGKKIDKVDLVK